MTRGVIYIASGEQFVREACISAESVKSALPDVPIGIITDVNVESEIFDDVIEMTDPRYSFGDQIQNMALSPYERTLYLDTDTIVSKDCNEIFEMLDRFDICLAYSQSREAWSVEDVPESFPEYNSGVVGYKQSPKMKEFLDTWWDFYANQEKEEGQNQPSLRRALYHSELQIGTLTTEYNCMFRYPGYVVGPVKIFHGRLLDINTPGAGEYHDARKAIEEINSTHEPRVFTQLGGIKVRTNKTDSIFHRARLAARQRGITHVIKEGLRLLRQKI